MAGLSGIQKNKRGVAIFLALAITVVIILVGIYLMERLVPASKSVKGVEQWNVAYYLAATAIEEALTGLSGSNPGTETGGTVGSMATTGYSFSTVASGTIVPTPGLGNSQFDRDWNLLKTGSPLQLKLKPGVDPGTLSIKLRVPDLNGDGSQTETLATGSGVINWIVVGNGETLLSESGSLFLSTEINGAAIPLGTRPGMILSGVPMTVTAFSSSASGCSLGCTLKFSIIRSLSTSTWEGVPFLEYQVSSPTTIPQQWSRISANGYVRWFKKTKTYDVQQTTVSEALDFTVFQ